MSTAVPLAGRYERFRNEIFSGLVEESPALPGWSEPMPELHLQSLWFAGEFGSEFTTVDGQRVTIRDFGIWNSGAGPDFAHCAVLFNGEVLTGDIELDPDVRDWERHGHGGNADYNRVVLHLFIHAPAESRAYTRTAEHREVPQVQLGWAAVQPRCGRWVKLRFNRVLKPRRSFDCSANRNACTSASQLMAASRPFFNPWRKPLAIGRTSVLSP